MVKHQDDSDLSSSKRLLIGEQRGWTRVENHLVGWKMVSQTQESLFLQTSDCSSQIDHFRLPKPLSQVTISITATSTIARGWQGQDQFGTDFNLKMMGFTGKIQKQASLMAKYCREVMTRKTQKNCCSCLAQQKDHFVRVFAEEVAITKMVFLAH